MFQRRQQGLCIGGFRLLHQSDTQRLHGFQIICPVWPRLAPDAHGQADCRIRLQWPARNADSASSSRSCCSKLMPNPVSAAAERLSAVSTARKPASASLARLSSRLIQAIRMRMTGASPPNSRARSKCASARASSPSSIRTTPRSRWPQGRLGAMARTVAATGRAASMSPNWSKAWPSLTFAS
jgi:hypothetical protein